MWGSSKRAYQRLLLVSVTSLVVMCGMTARASAEVSPLTMPCVWLYRTIRLSRRSNIRLLWLRANGARPARSPTIHASNGKVSGGRRRNETRQRRVRIPWKLSQEFPLGGKWRQRRIAGAGLDRTRWDVQNAQRELVKEVKETFYRILFLEEKRAFADQALAPRPATVAPRRRALPRR